MNARVFRAITGTAATAAVLFGAASANATTAVVTLPPTEIGLSVGSAFIFGPGDLRVGTDDAIGGVTVGGPFVTVTGTAYTGNLTNATADWRFEALGAPGNVTVLVTGVYDASAAGHSATVGNIFEGYSSRDFVDYFHAECDSQLGACSQQHFSIPITVQANIMQEIEIQVGGIVTSAAGGNFSVSIDPTITIAPAYAGQGYTVIVSPDAQPGAAPEPDAWVLMILGVGLAGAALRRRAPAFAG